MALLLCVYLISTLSVVKAGVNAYYLERCAYSICFVPVCEIWFDRVDHFDSILSTRRYAATFAFMSMLNSPIRARTVDKDK